MATRKHFERLIMTSKQKSLVTFALAKALAKDTASIKIKPGAHTINETVTMSVVGTIDVKEDTEARPKFSPKLEHFIAAMLDFYDDTQLRVDIKHTLSQLATRPDTFVKELAPQILIADEMIKEADAEYKKRAEPKPRKGSKSFHGEVKVIK